MPLPRVTILLLLLTLTASVMLIGGCGDAAETAAPPAAEPVTLTIAIEGMHCDGCVEAITGTVSRIEGVVSCDVSLEDEQAVVAVTDPGLADTIIEKINGLQYKARLAGG